MLLAFCNRRLECTSTLRKRIVSWTFQETSSESSKKAKKTPKMDRRRFTWRRSFLGVKSRPESIGGVMQNYRIRSDSAIIDNEIFCPLSRPVKFWILNSPFIYTKSPQPRPNSGFWIFLHDLSRRSRLLNSDSEFCRLFVKIVTGGHWILDFGFSPCFTRLARLFWILDFEFWLLPHELLDGALGFWILDSAPSSRKRSTMIWFWSPILST